MLEFEKEDISTEISSNITKMLHFVSKNSNYTLTELKNMYICEFYEYYRLVYDDVKNK